MGDISMAMRGWRYPWGGSDRQRITTAAFTLTFGLGIPSAAWADEVQARDLLRAMSDYIGAERSISFDYDSDLEIVTSDGQKLSLLSSGTVSLDRPDKIRATRTGGFADAELVFDGETLTLFGKNANLYGQVAMPGTIDQLVDGLREEYNRSLPAADLLLPNAYDHLMADVTDVKDLGSGVIGGIECDHLALRAADVDLQIWIAHGDKPYPCRYVVTSKAIEGSPQYTVDVRDWKTGADVVSTEFGFTAPAGAKKVEMSGLADTDELPASFSMGDGK